MAKIGVVKRGWRLDAILSVKVEPARFDRGRLPHFVPSVLGADRTVETQGGWRGGEVWQGNPVSGPWGLPGVV